MDDHREGKHHDIAHHDGKPHGHHGGKHHDAKHHDGDNGHGYKGHRFEDPEAWVERFESPERLAWQKPDEVVARLGLAPDATVADLGAGTGYFAVRLAAATPEGQVYAVDIEAAMVDWLGERAKREGLTNLESVLGAAHDPQLPGPVDLAFMCDVFHHLADPEAYFRAVAGQLSPGGQVVIVDFRKQLPEGTVGPPEAMRLSASSIEQRMQAAGYRLVDSELELLEFQYLLVFERADSSDGVAE